VNDPTKTTGAAPNEEPAPRSRTGTFTAVIALEGLVILALWWFSRHFSA
jgi:hypothetical protein